MADKTTVQNPFAEEKPQIVHFEKDESHYEYCRVQMHEIEHAHRRTFIGNLIICVLVCVLGIFQKYIGGFNLLAKPDHESRAAFFAMGVFQILMAFIIIVLGYLAWANFHRLNFLLEFWYVIVVVIGIYRLDYLTGAIGAVGVVLYFFSLRAIQNEERLSEMEGYPNFVEKFDVSKSDIIIQTLLAHKGEHLTKSTLFTTDYSLRRKKKKSSVSAAAGKEEETGAEALAQVLQKSVSEVRDAKAARTALASLDAVSAAAERGETDLPKPKNKSAVKYYVAEQDCELGIAAAEPNGTGAQIVYSEQIAKGTPISVTKEQVTIGGVPSTPVTHFRAGRYPDLQYRTRFDESDTYLAQCLRRVEEAEYQALTAPAAEAEPVPAEPEIPAAEPEIPAEPEAAAAPEVKPEQPAEVRNGSPQTGGNPNPQRKKKKRR